MTRIEKIELAISKGITYDHITGKIYGVKGTEITRKTREGYIRIGMKYKNKSYEVSGHQFAYYVMYNKCVDYIDHINQDKSDNRISNLRSVTNQENMFNTNAKGYYYNSRDKVFMAYIKINGKGKHLGTFRDENEARQAYLDAKKIYHKI